ncbi:MAG TPA: NADH-quinone oxidoreductase subunit D [Candidatus Thermoplasmatota archaeon]|nr:NADH-quinone oxidoreductase subunit D [Candidatus Thermoplasmatota archaeon]
MVTLNQQTAADLWKNRADRVPESGGQLKLVTLNMGPQHPSTHGVLRLKVTLEGEVVRQVEPVIGYLHRGVEKLFEDGSYLQAIPLTDRLDYVAAMHNNYALVHAVEKMAGIQVPERAQYLRALTMEVQRIASHYLWMGTFGLDLGAVTPFFWAMRDREGALGLMERMCGARLTYNYYRFGGLKNDMSPELIRDCGRYAKYVRERIPEFENVFTDNDIFQMRTQGVGKLSKETALSYGVSGPLARASGIDFDLRRDDPFNPVYQKVNWKVITSNRGDCYGRYLVRVAEMYQSLNIIEQIVADMPEKGDYLAPEVGAGARQHRVKGPEKAEVYGRVESAKGEMGVYICSDGTNRPYRMKWRPATLVNLAPLNDMCIGQKVPDLVATLGSIDIVLGDIDR